MGQRLFISAGDVSGDIHSANLVKAIKTIKPDTYIFGLGGEKLQGIADSFLCNLVNLGGFGFWQPFRQYFTLLGIFKKHIKDAWIANKPDKVILVDYYGFNIHVAKEARRQGIPVFYYISPQVWASRFGRVKKLVKYVNKMFVILPFEEEIYKKVGLDVTFTGHPLLDVIVGGGCIGPVLKAGLINQVSAELPVIGLFPGSRASVVKKHLPIFEETAKIIQKEIPCEIKIFGLNALKDFYHSVSFPVVYDDNGYSERKKIDFAITVSGTVSLENTLLGIPMVVIYVLSKLNYFIAKMLVSVPYITMANIIADKLLVPEFIQENADPQKIAAEVIKILKAPEHLQLFREQLLAIRKQLGTPGVNNRVAKMILDN